MSNQSDKIKGGIEFLVVIFLFVLVSFFVQKYVDTITSFIGEGVWGMVVYVFIVIIAIVVAPVSAIPFLPIASHLWGWLIAAFLSIIGWTIGAVIAFWIARRYGVTLVKKFAPMEKIERVERLVPHKNIFWSIVFLRMVIPVDILSYVLGLFSQISIRSYFFATIIGVSPFAFVFSYIGGMPLYYQLIALALAFLIFVSGLRVRLRYNKKEKGKK